MVRGEAGDGHHFGLCPTGRLQQASSSRLSKRLWGPVRLSYSGTYINTEKKDSHFLLFLSAGAHAMARIWRSDDNLKSPPFVRQAPFAVFPPHLQVSGHKRPRTAVSTSDLLRAQSLELLYCIWLYVGSQDLNSEPHSCIASFIFTKPSALLDNRFLFNSHTFRVNSHCEHATGRLGAKEPGKDTYSSVISTLSQGRSH